MIYFDNNATTPVAAPVFDAMRPFLEASFGNPSSAYSLAQDAREAVERARESVASLLGAHLPNEIVFTSCGTESDNWAIRGALQLRQMNSVVTTRVEHDAVRKLCLDLGKRGTNVTWLDVDSDGRLDLDHLRAAVTADTAVVSVMLANNETGILFPVAEIASIVKEHSNALVHVDGVNAVGKIPVDLKNTAIDLFSISAHKFYGPKGIGALYIREGVNLPSALIGGGQEQGRRAGTEAVHQLAGIGAAAEFVSDLAAMETVRALRDRLESGILNSISNAILNGTSDPAVRLPNTSSISFANTNGEMILARLDALGICVSTGSACNSADHSASPVLQAMNIPYATAMGSIRFSLGRFNTDAEVDRVLNVLPGIINELNALNG